MAQAIVCVACVCQSYSYGICYGIKPKVIFITCFRYAMARQIPDRVK